MARSTQDLIYYGAIEAFSEKGYNETTMDFIAEKAGVAKGTLYYNFKSKDVLFTNVMKRGIQKLTQITREVFDKPMDPRGKWEEVIRVQLNFFEQNRSFFRVLMQNIWGPNLQEQMTLQELLGDYFETLDQELRSAQVQNWIDSSLDVQTLSGSLFGMITIPSLRAVIHDKQINDEKRIHSITHLVLQFLQGGETL